VQLVKGVLVTMTNYRRVVWSPQTCSPGGQENGRHSCAQIDSTPRQAALHCTALHCTVLHFTASPGKIVPCRRQGTLHCTALHCTALHCTTRLIASCKPHQTSGPPAAGWAKVKLPVTKALYCTLYTVHCTLYTVHCTLYT
jgi:hypothetical protein